MTEETPETPSQADAPASDSMQGDVNATQGETACPDCMGTGSREGMDCITCNGTGQAPEESVGGG